MFGCADAEQMQAAGEHRPGGIGKGQPGTVDGRGFVLVGGQDRAVVMEPVMEPEEGIGDADEMPRELVGRTVPGGGLDGAGVIGEEGEKAGLGGVVVRPGLGLGLSCEAELAGVPHQGAGTGMGVPNPEKGVVLALGEKPGGVEIGQIMPGGPKQRPAGGVGAEGAEQLDPGDRNGPNNRPTTCDNNSSRGVDEPSHHMSDQGGPHLGRGPERNGNPGKRVPVPVAGPRGEDVAHKLSMGTGIKGDVEKPRSSDLNAGNPGRTNQPPPQNLSDDERVPLTPLTPVPSGQEQGDIGGVIPTPRPRRRPHLHPLRHGNAQLVVLNGTTHGVQHSAGELGGSHGTSVWEEGGTKANRFRPSDEHPTGEPRPGPEGGPGPRTPKEAKPRTQPKPDPRTQRKPKPRAQPKPNPPGRTGRKRPGPGAHHYPVGPTTGSASPGAAAPAAPCLISRRTSSTRSTGSKGFARKASTPSAFPLSISYCVHALMIATGT